jgi:hypothetical protein
VNVEHLEDVLRRYRPSGPPAELRNQVLGGDLVGRPFQGRRRRDWIYPIATAAAALTLYALTDSTHRRIMSATSTTDAEREAAVAEMTADLGGDDTARLEAERLIRAIESAARVDPQLQDTVAIEETTRE